jgi:hypothetical protein
MGRGFPAHFYSSFNNRKIQLFMNSIMNPHSEQLNNLNAAIRLMRQHTVRNNHVSFTHFSKRILRILDTHYNGSSYKFVEVNPFSFSVTFMSVLQPDMSVHHIDVQYDSISKEVTITSQRCFAAGTVVKTRISESLTKLINSVFH